MPFLYFYLSGCYNEYTTPALNISERRGTFYGLREVYQVHQSAESAGLHMAYLFRAFKARRINYDLFKKNDIIIHKETAGKLRQTDLIAVEKYQGNLKQALRYIATTPDFTS